MLLRACPNKDFRSPHLVFYNELRRFFINVYGAVVEHLTVRKMAEHNLYRPVSLTFCVTDLQLEQLIVWVEGALPECPDAEGGGDQVADILADARPGLIQEHGAFQTISVPGAKLELPGHSGRASCWEREKYEAIADQRP